MEIFENIISGPIFLQVPVFGLQLAIILYQLEHVRLFQIKAKRELECLKYWNQDPKDFNWDYAII